MNIRSVWLVGASAIVMSGGALAQGQSAAPNNEPAQSADAGQPNLEEIVVTARRSRETLLDTPVNDTVFTSKRIEQLDITSLDEVAEYTTSFNITHSEGSRGDRAEAVYSIRGMTPGSSATATVFIDGAPISAGFIDGLDDSAQIEVLKGPQSAAFGRSVFAGAINITTKIPADEFHGSLDLSAGSYNYTDDRLSLEGPLVPGKLDARIYARYYSRDGQYTNAAEPSELLGSQSTKSVTGEVYATPTDNLTFKFFGAYSLEEDGPSAVEPFVRANYNCDAGGPPTYHGLNYICGTLPSSPNLNTLAQNDVITPTFRQQVLNNASGLVNPIFPNSLGLNHGGLEHQIVHTGLTIEYEFADNLVLTSLTSYNDDRYDLIHDYDNQDSNNDPNPYYGVLPYAPPTYNWLFNTQDDNRDYSQEFRLNGTYGPFKGMLGLSYVYNYTQYVNSALTPYGVGNEVNGNPQEIDTYGGFFSFSYDIFPELTLDFDGRYQLDDVIQYARGLNNGPITKASSGDFRNFVPRVILQYRPIPNTQLYASYSQGVNPGTFNASFINGYTPSQVAYIDAHDPGVGFEVKPEQLDNYEIGAKGDFLDHRLQLDGALYYAVWSNQIVYQNLAIPLTCSNPPCGLTEDGFYTNIGKTNLYGVEIEGTATPIDGLTINFAASYNESSIQQFQSAVAQTLTGNATIKNKELPQYSPYNATLGAEYRGPLIADINYYARADYVYKSGQWDSVANLVKTTGSNQVNVRLGLERPRERLEFFVTNLFNNKAFQGIESNYDLLDPNFGAAVNAQLPVLRILGVRFRQTF
jgi:iron complex outermembrane receptor protein